MLSTLIVPRRETRLGRVHRSVYVLRKIYAIYTLNFGDNLSTKDKRHVPKVSIVQRFHCIALFKGLMANMHKKKRRQDRDGLARARGCSDIANYASTSPILLQRSPACKFSVATFSSCMDSTKLDSHT